MLRLDPASPEPPFAQLRAQIAEQVTDRTLRPGDRLPTVRRLAGDLGIAPNTVARAYRELEADGLIVGRGRAGTFVTGPSATADDHAAAQQAATSYARTVHSLGIDPEEALLLVRRALRA
ncbi:GntR family transcriptional regulator [Georgenia sp. H159]|uniref:GntR family transcriptional regulator n=1 Tax=Georgenia sp. H159 TaxID=3076115 RepID=UPI002D783C42|nr:GntR family transcriptional regulator [Georgenia sp. H159]